MTPQWLFFSFHMEATSVWRNVTSIINSLLLPTILSVRKHQEEEDDDVSARRSLKRFHFSCLYSAHASMCMENGYKTRLCAVLAGTTGGGGKKNRHVCTALSLH